MTPNTASRHIVPGKAASVAELIARINADETLGQREKRDWTWGLRAFCRVGGKSPDQVTIDPASMRRLVAKVAPCAHGLSKASWNNARSAVNKALEYAGRIAIPRRCREPLAAPWADLWSLLPAESWKNGLRAIFRYCSDRGLAPEALDDTVLKAFHDTLVEESRFDDPWDVYRASAKVWNKAVESVPGWPSQCLDLPTKVTVFSMPWSAFPAGLIADVDAYCRCATGLNLLEDRGFKRRQSEATLETRRKQLRWLATGMVHAGISPADLTGLLALVDPDRAAVGLEYLRDRRGEDTFTSLSQTADFLPTLARRLDAPADVVARLIRIREKLAMEPKGLSEKHRETLERFNDPEAVHALLSLPERVMTRIEKTKDHIGVRDVLMLQSALAVQLLINAPVRVRNLASIEIARHIVVVDKHGTRHLRFPKREVKNKVDLEFVLTPDTGALLDLYLELRPHLGYDDECFLFPGNGRDGHKTGTTLSRQIDTFVFDNLGIAMPAHRFRHALAKIFLDAHPGHYETVRQFLGHKDIQTTTQFYAGAETARASAHYNATILGLKGDPGVTHV